MEETGTRLDWIGSIIKGSRKGNKGMSELIQMTNGATVDLHTKAGAYEYVADFLGQHSASGDVFSALEMLAPCNDKWVETQLISRDG